jgi:Tfp pilus assembly protein PilX
MRLLGGAPAWLPRGRDDAGVVTTFVIVFAVLLVFVTGLVLDGGRMLAEHRRAGNLADAAARAGAQAISEDAVRAGATDILHDAAAEAAACGFVDDPDYSCRASADGNRVDVTLTGSIDLLMLPGGSPAVVADGSACAALGITDATC